MAFFRTTTRWFKEISKPKMAYNKWKHYKHLEKEVDQWKPDVYCLHLISKVNPIARKD